MDQVLRILESGRCTGAWPGRSEWHVPAQYDLIAPYSLRELDCSLESLVTLRKPPHDHRMPCLTNQSAIAYHRLLRVVGVSGLLRAELLYQVDVFAPI